VKEPARTPEQPGPPGSAPPRGPARRGGRPVLLLAGAALAAAGIAAGALGATGAFSGGSSKHAAATTGGTGSGGSVAQTDAVLSVLHRYETAFSNRDAGGLGALLTPNVTRLGLRPPAPGCQVQAGLQSVVRAEQTNFGGVYRFVGLSPNEVHVSGNTATVSTAYSISSGGSGAIRFVLVNGTGGWLITRINANC
jgi:hypothetical protein